MITIYKLTAPNGKSYVGQTNNLTNRLYHYSSYHCKHQQKLYHSLLKYKWENFTIETLEYAQDEFADEYEKFYIKKFDCVLNGLNLDDGGNSNKTRSKETRDKISKSNMGRKGMFGKDNPFYGKKHTKETIDGIKKKLTGRKRPPRSEEWSKNISDANSGSNHWFYNTHLSTEHKTKLSDALKGKKHLTKITEETRKKMIDSHKGQVPWNKGLKLKKTA